MITTTAVLLYAITSLHTLMIFWHSNRGSPTKLVPLTERIWSPTLSLPDLAAGPSFARWAIMAQGIMDPQPDSTIITPRCSWGFLLTITYKNRQVKEKHVRRAFFLKRKKKRNKEYKKMINRWISFNQTGRRWGTMTRHSTTKTFTKLYAAVSQLWFKWSPGFQTALYRTIDVTKGIYYSMGSQTVPQKSSTHAEAVSSYLTIIPEL